MLSRTGLVVLLLMPILFGCSSNKDQKIIIVFEKPPTLKKAQELVLNLSSSISNKNLSKFLDNQNWINSFLIKKHMNRRRRKVPMHMYVRNAIKVIAKLVKNNLGVQMNLLQLL